MRRIILGIMALSCVVLFAPLGAAAQSTNLEPQEENLCGPDFNAEFDQGPALLAMDYPEMERVRIELLERGFDPGFNPDPAIASRQLCEALAEYQSQYDLPVSGQLDPFTLAALGVPLQKSTIVETQRAKPGK